MSIFRRAIEPAISALKPFVCSSNLCLFQLISLGLGPSLEHEIKTNSAAVDLLVQLAYTSAKEGALKGDHQPAGLSLEVPKNPNIPWNHGDPVDDFDTLDLASRNTGVWALISQLPPIVSSLPSALDVSLSIYLLDST